MTIAKKKAGSLNGVGPVLGGSRHPLANCRPRGDRVVVRRDAARDKTPGGILLPGVAAQKQQIGVVHAVGPGKADADGYLTELDIKVGDRVIITGYAGLMISDPTGADAEDEFVILREDDVLAILN